MPDPRIAVRLALTDDARELLADARALEAAGADALWVDATDADPYVALAAAAAVTHRIRLVAAGSPAGPGRATCALLARGRLVVAEESATAGERWVHAAFPAGRDEWRALRADAIATGATGIVLRNDPRLMDLLRNPDQIYDRADINLASG